jgi:hypothetical protein
MLKKLVVAGAVALAFSSVASAQTTIPGGINPGTSGLGPDISTPVPGTAGTINSGDPRRAPSGSRANDSSRIGTTGGVDAGSAVGGSTDPVTGRAGTGSGAMGSGSIGTGSIGSGASGTITSGAGAPLPGAGGVGGSGSVGGAAGVGGAGTGAGTAGGGAAGAGGAGGAR